MSPTDSLGISWPALIDRLNLHRALDRWAAAEPLLVSLGTIDEVARIVHDRDAPGRGNSLLAALVRIAATDGGGDDDAALLVAHLLANGTGRLAVQLRDLSDDIDAVIAGALWIQIRTFPWRRRTRAIAKSLLLDTRSAVLADLCPYRSRSGLTRVVLHEPTLLAETQFRGRSQDLVDGPVSDSGSDLLDLLDWARAAGAIARCDVLLLLDLIAAANGTDDGVGHGPRRGLNVAAEITLVAARWGVNEKTVRRRRDRALNALRDVRDDYLAAVA